MPRMKTRKAVAKRFKVTGNGKVMYKRPGNNHLQTGKSRKSKRQRSKPKRASKADEKRIKQMLPG